MPCKPTAVALLLTCAVLAAPSKPQSDALPPCSGLVGWGEDRYLVSHDWKDGQPGARFGLVEVGRRLSYRPLETDWSAVTGGDPSDIESLCPVDGLPGNFLACESGYYGGKYGRFFWFEMADSASPQARVLRQYALPPHLTQEIEGLATLKLGPERWMILLGGRGGREAEPGHLYWGVLDRTTGQLEWPKEGLEGVEIRLPRRLGPFTRTLSDMYLDPHGKLFVSSCSTPGDQGPNRSLIFQAGTISNDLKHPFRGTAEAQPVWWVDGVRIEGLSPCSRRGYGPAYVTDDDDLDGLWRAVPASPSLGY